MGGPMGTMPPPKPDAITMVFEKRQGEATAWPAMTFILVMMPLSRRLGIEVALCFTKSWFL